SSAPGVGSPCFVWANAHSPYWFLVHFRLTMDFASAFSMSMSGSPLGEELARPNWVTGGEGLFCSALSNSPRAVPLSLAFSWAWTTDASALLGSEGLAAFGPGEPL